MMKGWIAYLLAANHLKTRKSFRPQKLYQLIGTTRTKHVLLLLSILRIPQTPHFRPVCLCRCRASTWNVFSLFLPGDLPLIKISAEVTHSWKMFVLSKHRPLLSVLPHYTPLVMLSMAHDCWLDCTVLKGHSFSFLFLFF